MHNNTDQLTLSVGFKAYGFNEGRQSVSYLFAMSFIVLLVGVGAFISEGLSEY